MNSLSIRWFRAFCKSPTRSSLHYSSLLALEDRLEVVRIWLPDPVLRLNLLGRFDGLAAVENEKFGVLIVETDDDVFGLGAPETFGEVAETPNFDAVDFVHDDGRSFRVSLREAPGGSVGQRDAGTTESSRTGGGNPPSPG
jgi:hypothetical protein